MADIIRILSVAKNQHFHKNIRQAFMPNLNSPDLKLAHLPQQSDDNLNNKKRKIGDSDHFPYAINTSEHLGNGIEMAVEAAMTGGPYALLFIEASAPAF